MIIVYVLTRWSGTQSISIRTAFLKSCTPFPGKWPRPVGVLCSSSGFPTTIPFSRPRPKSSGPRHLRTQIKTARNIIKKNHSFFTKHCKLVFFHRFISCFYECITNDGTTIKSFYKSLIAPTRQCLLVIGLVLDRGEGGILG